MIPSNPIWSVIDLANVVRNSRREQKMTQAELARRAHVSRPWISQFESGKIANPTFDRILTICDVLGVRLGAEYRPADNKDEVEKATNSDIVPHALARSLQQAAKTANTAIAQSAASALRPALTQYRQLLTQENQRIIDQFKRLKLPPIKIAIDPIATALKENAVSKDDER